MIATGRRCGAPGISGKADAAEISSGSNTVAMTNLKVLLINRTVIFERDRVDPGFSTSAADGQCSHLTLPMLAYSSRQRIGKRSAPAAIHIPAHLSRTSRRRVSNRWASVDESADAPAELGHPREQLTTGRLRSRFRRWCDSANTAACPGFRPAGRGRRGKHSPTTAPAVPILPRRRQWIVYCCWKQESWEGELLAE